MLGVPWSETQYVTDNTVLRSGLNNLLELTPTVSPVFPVVGYFTPVDVGPLESCECTRDSALEFRLANSARPVSRITKL